MQTKEKLCLIECFSALFNYLVISGSRYRLLFHLLSLVYVIYIFYFCFCGYNELLMLNAYRKITVICQIYTCLRISCFQNKAFIWWFQTIHLLPSRVLVSCSSVTAFWASPRFGHQHSQILSVLGVSFSYFNIKMQCFGYRAFLSGRALKLINTDFFDETNRRQTQCYKRVTF